MCCRLQEGYEPPQGKLSVDSCLPEGSLRLGEQPAQWSLSEDPEDRKDSLWIWGLFSDPLYPFLLFQLDLAAPVDFPEEATETLPTLLRPVPVATTRHSTRPSFPLGRLHSGGASLLPGQKRRGGRRRARGGGFPEPSLAGF